MHRVHIYLYNNGRSGDASSSGGGTHWVAALLPVQQVDVNPGGSNVDLAVGSVSTEDATILKQLLLTQDIGLEILVQDAVLTGLPGSVEHAE